MRPTLEVLERQLREVCGQEGAGSDGQKEAFSGMLTDCAHTKFRASGIVLHIIVQPD